MTRHPHTPASHADNLLDSVEDYRALQAMRGTPVLCAWGVKTGASVACVTVGVKPLSSTGDFDWVVKTFRPRLHDALRAANLEFQKWRAETDADSQDGMTERLQRSVEVVHGERVANANGGES